MKIPIPTLEEQEIIIADTRFLEHDIGLCQKLKINVGRKRNIYMHYSIKGSSMRKLNKVYTIGNITEIEYGTRITKGENENLNMEDEVYPVYGGGDISFYTDKYNREGATCKISRF